MDAGLATLCGVVVGALLGFLAEPIKARVENRHKRR